ncbi:SOUL family heme-binding protein [Magnetospirillum molischianum]|uniref:SOUL heme-binding protein n=1 Tax=Magnetospirillum molischianum DSM 120 TaxID=1150626 RepID=H8FPV3_MAGML|nr:heme-binding protein [Magnetospirillum molischianum]CCG40391.1 SOUL heme-binding protein [Magnetospirillum molischianum DSM 120]
MRLSDVGNGLAVAGSFALLSACTVVGIRSGTEQPVYEVVATLADDIEIRHYGPRIAAETDVDGTESEARNQAFRILAGYIFGGNRDRQKVAMTAPVETERSRSIAMTTPVEGSESGGRKTMRFFMPSSFTMETLPVPDDDRVRLVEIPAQTLAVLRFTGWRDSEAIAQHQGELLTRLDGTAWLPQGAPTSFLYDPPWTLPFLRRNEAAVAVVRRDG